VRTIASRIEYSPGIVYHYFKDKAEIVSRIVSDGYARILAGQKTVKVFPSNPTATFHGVFKAYVDLAMENPHLFRAVLLEDLGEASRNVHMLEEGIAKKRETVARLCALVSGFVEAGIFRAVDLELTALAIWCSVHGLLTRFLLEPHIDARRRDTLLRHLIEVLVRGLLK
jgi:AcrR family transcriptional regulator